MSGQIGNKLSTPSRVTFYYIIGLFVLTYVYKFSDDYNLISGLINFFEFWGDYATYDKFSFYVEDKIHRLETFDLETKGKENLLLYVLWPIQYGFLEFASWEVTYHICHFLHGLVDSRALEESWNYLIVGIVLLIVFLKFLSSESSAKV